MTAKPTKRYEHFDEPVANGEPVIAGVGMHSQTTLRGNVNKWVRLTRLPNESSSKYLQRVKRDAEKIAKYRSHLLIAKRFRLNSSRLVALACEQRHIGYGWMPVLGENSISFLFAKAIAIWLNSTLGRIALRRVTGRTIAYPTLNPIAFDGVPFVDISDAAMVDILRSSYDLTCDEVVPQFQDGRVAVREAWDDAVSLALGIERDLIARCADMLARDPFVSKNDFYEQM
ncbi:MAG: hypothetical protein OXG24_04735 [Gammaproteobacteria bacterium]|nr:hypothetical protein [Gammaproteobacteria bacterium]